MQTLTALVAVSLVLCSLARIASIELRPQAGHVSGAASRPQPSSLNWVFEVHTGHDGSPHSSVFLRIKGQRVLILRNMGSQFHVIDRQDYSERKIPAQAVTACTGWWAGQGEDLYALRSGRKVTVFIRDLDEEAPIPAYKPLKSFLIR